ncbi:MAG: YkgJ family cysteine cluster protein [Desulfobacterales bacterium]|jgi:Fe-S-cluster containining protein|nr:YkgJ family cysteine cluster protein [Desulfobacterales bacterium]
MNMDMTPFFQKYVAIVNKVDNIFGIMKEKYPDEVRCTTGCSDCCHALFDLTLIEAVYVSHQFRKNFSGDKRDALLEKANKADRQTYKIKKAAFTAKQQGKDEEVIIADVAKERVRCAMLNDDNLCDFYEFRPLACRLDGIPAAIGGKGRTCNLSGFKSGQSYPTVNRDILHDQLLALSAELVTSILTKFTKMGDILVPLSMALITEYDENYFGMSDPKDSSQKETDAGKNESA